MGGRGGGDGREREGERVMGGREREGKRERGGKRGR